MKILCTKCNVEKDITEFRKDQYNSTGRNSHCSTCHNQYQKKYYNANLNKVRTYATEYYKKNAKRISKLRKARKNETDKTLHLAESNKDKKKRASQWRSRDGWIRHRERLWKTSGIVDFSMEQYKQMLKLQKGKCYICNSIRSKSRALSVDHSHKTGKVRALLCNNCNNGMGKLQDSIEILQKTIEYLKKYGE